jgi:hypothetical protein
MNEQIQENGHTVSILLVVWGEQYIHDFLQFSLPSLLAPGNVPALAAAYKTKFIFLTQTKDFAILQESLAFQKITTYCEVQFIAIDDLLLYNNKTCTLTLAYDRAVQQSGKQMLNTYFVFLTVDYIMADGSLQGLMRYMQQGYSAICAGNFQVIKENMAPFLLTQINPETHAIQIGPRDLLTHSFPHLHPIVIANLFEKNIVHNEDANRFFLRYNEQIMVGRFYLLHMLCIKPEITHYQVSSSCDYSFVPEMCPSGNIAVITDSDDYLVVEIQPKDHELAFIKYGAYQHKKLVQGLAAWTTKQHRANAQYSIYFHTQDITPEEKTIVAQRSDKFIKSLTVSLQAYKEQPYRDHPYWLGAMRAATKQATFLKRLYFFLWGMPPTVKRWHARWHEYQSVMNAIQKHIGPENATNTLVVYNASKGSWLNYHYWLKQSFKVSYYYPIQELLSVQGSQLTALQQCKFATCIFLMDVESLPAAKEWLIFIKNILAVNGKVLMLIKNTKNNEFKCYFKADFARQICQIINTSYDITDITTIYSNLTLLSAVTIKKIKEWFSYAHLRFLLFFLLSVSGSIFSLLINCLPKASRGKSGHCTHILITLTASGKTL